MPSLLEETLPGVPPQSEQDARRFRPVVFCGGRPPDHSLLIAVEGLEENGWSFRNSVLASTVDSA